MNIVLSQIHGVPEGTTHLLFSACNVGYSYSCCVDILRLHDGVWYRHERDSDGEYPQFAKAQQGWLDRWQPHFVAIGDTPLATSCPACR